MPKKKKVYNNYSRGQRNIHIWCQHHKTLFIGHYRFRVKISLIEYLQLSPELFVASLFPASAWLKY